MKKYLSLFIALVIIMSMIITPVTFAQGTYTPFSVVASLGISLDDAKDLRDLLKDYYDYKGSVKGAIEELRDSNLELEGIFNNNGITSDITKEVIDTLLDTADPQSITDLDELITALDDLKDNYQYLIDNLGNTFESGYDFSAEEGSRFATYMYYIGVLMQDKKIMTFDENGKKLYFSFADEYKNSTKITTNVGGTFHEYTILEYIDLAADRGGKTFDDLDTKLENSLNSMLNDYLNSGEANYTTREIADVVKGFSLLKEIDTTPTPPNPGGGGGGGYMPPTAQNGPKAVNDKLVTGINIPVEVTVEELLANDRDAERFVGLGKTNNGTVSINGNVITFTPKNNFKGRGIFRYVIADKDGNEDTGMVLIEISKDFILIDDNVTPLGSGGPDQLSVVDSPDIEGALVYFSGAYLEGYPDGTFRPNAPVTRAEVVAILTRILEIDITDPGEALFSDVKVGEWYYEEVQAATKHKLINGYPDGTFKPNKPVTNGEVAAILSNYWTVNSIMVPITEVGMFDISDHWARYYIRRMYNAGISVRFGDGTFRPNKPTTRSEFAIMINQFIGRETNTVLKNKFIDVTEENWGFGAIEAAAETLE